ncbi:MAG: alginate export family protein [Thermodesulfobacteriota bacterium]
MKRLLLSVFAAAITAVWAMPATATDFSFSGQYRVRGEYRGNPNFVDDAAQSVVLQRVRLTTNAQVTDDTSVKITLQDSRAWGATPNGNGGPRLTDVGDNHLDLHESYMLVKNILDQPVSLKVGRQEFVYGDQRLLGAFGWNNNGRSFDAAKLTYNSDPIDIDVFGSKIREASSAGVNGGGGGDEDLDFYGIYATIKSIPNNTVDVYALALRDGNGGTNAFNQGTTYGNTSLNFAGGGILDKAQVLYTYGARVKGAYSGLDYTLEVPFQTGSIDTTATTGITSYDIGAWALAAKAGYTLPTAMKIRVGAQYVIASGDDDAADSDLETFANLFPTNHGHYGFADQQGWRNVDAWAIDAVAQVNSQLKLYLAWWSFDLNEQADAWYSAGNWMNTSGALGTSGVSRAASSTNIEDEIGSEIDFVATYKYNSAVTAQFGWSRFFTGKFIESQVAGGNVDDMDFAYLQLITNF